MKTLFAIVFAVLFVGVAKATDPWEPGIAGYRQSIIEISVHPTGSSDCPFPYLLVETTDGEQLTKYYDGRCDSDSCCGAKMDWSFDLKIVEKGGEVEDEKGMLSCQGGGVQVGIEDVLTAGLETFISYPELEYGEGTLALHLEREITILVGGDWKTVKQELDYIAKLVEGGVYFRRTAYGEFPAQRPTEWDITYRVGMTILPKFAGRLGELVRILDNPPLRPAQ